MAIKMTCACGKRMAIDKQYIGRKIACPGCGKKFVLDRARLAAMIRRQSKARTAESVLASSAPEPASLDGEFESPADSDLLGLLGDDEINAEIASKPTSTIKPLGRGMSRLDQELVAQSDATPNGVKRPTCPSCKQVLPANAKLCIQCGINIKSGRGIVTSTDGHLDTAYGAAEGSLTVLSFFMPFGFMPIASEAFGTRKTHSVRVIALITTLTSVAFWCFAWASPESITSVRNLAMWCGTPEKEPGYLYNLYEVGRVGDSAAFHTELDKAIKRRVDEITLDAKKDAKSSKATSEIKDSDDENSEWTETEIKTIVEPAIIEAHNALEPQQQTTGQYHTYQLLTNAFLHGGTASHNPVNFRLIWESLTHLIGNLIFLIVFGSGVNAMLGNRWTPPLYLLLAIIASVVYLMTSKNEPPHYALGASGAIMGMAGMYLVFFPVQLVHMVAWIRFIIPIGILIRIGKLHMKIFAVRGFWVVLFYIAFDVLYTVLGIQDGTAHWAHLGGFIGGVCIALMLLVTRRVNAHGTDIISMILGRRAWALVGRPRA